MAIIRKWIDIDIPGLTPFLYGSGTTGSDGKIYFGEGFNNGSYLLTQEWNSLDMSTATPTLSGLTPFPGTHRNAQYLFRIGNKIYIGGGAEIDSLPIYDDWWAYDVTNDTWEQVDSMPPYHYFTVSNPATNISGRAYPILHTHATTGKMYFGQGFVLGQAMTDWYEYDPATEIFTPKQSFPGAGRPACVTCIIGDYIYLANGCDLDALPTYAEVWRYDTVNDLWEQLQDKPGDQIAGGASFVIDGKWYVVSGYVITQTVPMLGHDSAQVWCYTPSGDSWEALADFPGVPFSDSGFICDGTRAAIFGGIFDGTEINNNSDAYMLSQIYLFDPDTGWEQLSASEATLGQLCKHQGTTVGTTGYLFGGLIAGPMTFSQAYYEFDWNSLTLTKINTPLSTPVYMPGVDKDLNGLIHIFHGRDGVSSITNNIQKLRSVSGIAAGATQQAVSMNGYGYVFLGVQVFEGVSTDVPWCYKFDPNASPGSQWTKLTDFPGSLRSDATVMSDGSSIFVGFGINDAVTEILDECWLYSNTVGEDVTTSAYAISNYPVGFNGDPSLWMQNAFDKDVNTFWIGGASSPYWIGQDFGAGNEKTIIQYSIRIRPDATSEAPQDFTFEASDTGAWGGEQVILDTQTGYSTWGMGEMKTFNINNSTPYRYYRLNVSTLNTADPYCGISELTMCVSGYGWEQLTNTVVPARFKAVGVGPNSVGGKGLIIGGLIGLSFEEDDKFYSFDFTTKRFKQEGIYTGTGGVDSAVGARLSNGDVVLISGRINPSASKSSISYYRPVAPELPWIGGYKERILSTPGLVGYWKFDNNFEDSSDNALDGSLTGDVTFVAPKIGVKSASFNGGYVTIPHNSLFNVTDALTWILWLKPNSLDNQGILSKDGLSETETDTYMLSSDTNVFRVRFNYPNFDYTLPLTIGVWSHVVITYDREFVRGYINGELLLEQAFTEAIITNTNDLVLGCYYNPSYPYSGSMDDFAFFSRALDEWEIKAIYASSVEPPSNIKFIHSRDKKSTRENI